MNCWDILEIKKTDDLKTIKKAYAKKLKTIDAENDIEGFQNLKEAYDSCINSAKNKDNFTKIIYKEGEMIYRKREEEDLFINKRENFKEEIESSIPFAKEEVKKKFDKMELLQEMIGFSESLEFYSNLEVWKELVFKYYENIEIDEIEIFRETIREFLVEYLYLINGNIIKYLVDTFKIEEILCQDKNGVEPHIADYLIRPEVFTSEAFKKVERDKRFKYLQVKVDAFMLYNISKLNGALDRIEACKKKVIDDDLLKLEVYCYGGLAFAGLSSMFVKRVEKIIPILEERVVENTTFEFKLATLIATNFANRKPIIEVSSLEDYEFFNKEIEMLKGYYLEKNTEMVLKTYEKYQTTLIKNKEALEIIKEALSHELKKTKDKKKQNNYILELSKFRKKEGRKAWRKNNFKEFLVMLIIFLIIPILGGIARGVYTEFYKGNKEKEKYKVNESYSERDLEKNFLKGKKTSIKFNENDFEAIYAKKEGEIYKALSKETDIGDVFAIVNSKIGDTKVTSIVYGIDFAILKNGGEIFKENGDKVYFTGNLTKDKIIDEKVKEKFEVSEYILELPNITNNLSKVTEKVIFKALSGLITGILLFSIVLNIKVNKYMRGRRSDNRNRFRYIE